MFVVAAELPIAEYTTRFMDGLGFYCRCLPGVDPPPQAAAGQLEVLAVGIWGQVNSRLSEAFTLQVQCTQQYHHRIHQHATAACLWCSRPGQHLPGYRCGCFCLQPGPLACDTAAYRQTRTANDNQLLRLAGFQVSVSGWQPARQRHQPPQLNTQLRPVTTARASNANSVRLTNRV